MAHDELRYAVRHEMMQDLSKETITFRNNDKMRSLPMRSIWVILTWCRCWWFWSTLEWSKLPFPSI